MHPKNLLQKKNLLEKKDLVSVFTIIFLYSLDRTRTSCSTSRRYSKISFKKFLC